MLAVSESSQYVVYARAISIIGWHSSSTGSLRLPVMRCFRPSPHTRSNLFRLISVDTPILVITLTIRILGLGHMLPKNAQPGLYSLQSAPLAAQTSTQAQIEDTLPYIWSPYPLDHQTPSIGHQALIG